MSTLDKRLHAYRDDLADIRLKGRVQAARFVDGIRKQITVPTANVHRAPGLQEMQITQALMGETVRVFEEKGDWAWVQLESDGYVGYVSCDALGADVHPPTHRVWQRMTLAFPRADLKSQPVKPLPMNARLAVVGKANGFLELANGTHVFAEHCRMIDCEEPDFTEIAELFVHVPYLWGGKSALGLDCSGLVQVSMQAAGITCPRDTDMQEAALGTPVTLDEARRGDLVFWKGHVGIMVDDRKLLHANGHHLLTVVEPLDDAIARIAAKGTPVSSVKRVQ